MGLVKARWRLAEDMHRRGEASEGTLPKATRRARKRVHSPYQAARKQQRAVRECCQCGNVANFQLGIGIGSCGGPGAHMRFSPCVLRLETTRTTGKNNFERGARANSPAHLSSDVCMNPYIIVSFLIGLWARAS